MVIPDVSFIITAYNVENFIAVAVQSAWDTARLLDGMSAEVLVVDDGSDDQTAPIVQALVDRFAGRMPLRLHRFAQNTPGGTGTGSNFGLDQAQGDWIIFIDGDDWVLPASTAAAIHAIRAGGYDLLVTDCAEYWNDDGDYTKWPEAAYWDKLETETDESARKSALLHMAPFPWRKIYRRAFLNLQNIRFPEGDFFFEDNPFHWEAVIKARHWGWLRQETHIHRRARACQSLERNDSGYLHILDHFDTMQAMLDRTGAQDTHAPDLLDWLIRHIAWAAGRLHTDHWATLFDAARVRLQPYSKDQLWEALYRGNAKAALSPREQRLIHAVLQDDWRGFVRSYDPAVAGDTRAQDRG